MTFVTANPVPFGAFDIFRLTNKHTSFAMNLRRWIDVLATRRVLARLSSSQMQDIGLTEVRALTVSKLLERA